MWAVVRRVFAAVGLVVAGAGFAAFATAAVYVWRVKAETNRRTDDLAGKAHQALNAADKAVAFVRDVIDAGERDLREAQQAPAPPREPVNPFLQLTARRGAETLAGSVEKANDAVAIASDAAVVAEAALSIFGDDAQLSELKNWLGVKPEQLAQTRAQLDRAAGDLKQVQTILGVPLGDGGPTADQLRAVAAALVQARDLTEQMDGVVRRARARVDDTKRAVDLWALRLALGVTLVGAVGALGQCFTARYCWRVLRGQPA